MLRRGVVAFGIAVCVGLAGCDGEDELPVAVLTQQEEPAEPELPPRPTTQELVEGSRIGLILDSLPLRMQVPPQWKITRHGSTGSVVWVEGPSPHSEARISLKEREAMPPQQFEAYLSGIRRAEAEGKDTFIFRTTGPIQIIERRSLMSPVTVPLTDIDGLPILDDKGEVTMHTSTPLRWWISCFVPREDRVEHYELTLVDLTQEQFAQDQKFLEDMVSTITYTGPAPATPSTQPQ